MAKPIVVIYFPDQYDSGLKRNWIFDFMAQLNNGIDPAMNMNFFVLPKDTQDYHWFCFYKQDILEPEVQVFHEKDFTEIQFAELKKLVEDAIPKNEAANANP